MDLEQLQRIVAALVARVGTGVCRIGPREMAEAPVEKLRISTDENGDLWLNFNANSPAEEDTWTVDD